MSAGSSIHTVDGHLFDFDDPMAATITDHDIAHGLANICRFGGQASQFYSVAEHAILVCVLVYNHYRQPQLAFAALHHDSAEAYMGDIPTPLKHKLGVSYRRIYREVEAAVGAHVQVPVDDFHAGVIKDADALAMEIEAFMLKPNGWDRNPAIDVDELERMSVRLVDAWDSHTAEHKFLRCHSAFASGKVETDPDKIRPIDYAAPFTDEEQAYLDQMRDDSDDEG